MAALCPECRAGKHGNCDGRALDEERDQVVQCGCSDPTHTIETNPAVIRDGWDDDESPSDSALALLRQRLTDPSAEATRKGRYHSAMANGRLEAVLRVADDEQSTLRAKLAAVENLMAAPEFTDTGAAVLSVADLRTAIDGAT